MMPIFAQELIIEEFFTPGKVLFFLALITAIIIYVYVYRDRFFSAGKTVLSSPEPKSAPEQAAEKMDTQNSDKAEEARIAAAIGAALNLYMEEMQEFEKTVLTIQKIIKPYSPWSSKIYGLRQTPTVTRTGRRS